jgi:hypothetical protein
VTLFVGRAMVEGMVFIKTLVFIPMLLLMTCSMTGHSTSSFFISNYKGYALNASAEYTDTDIKDTIPQIEPNETRFIIKIDNVLSSNGSTPEEVFKSLRIYIAGTDSLINDPKNIKNALWKKEELQDNFVKYYYEVN